MSLDLYPLCSYLLENDQTGKFKDVTAQVCTRPACSPVLLPKAKWFDIDKDGDPDLLVSMEWNGICSLYE